MKKLIVEEKYNNKNLQNYILKKFPTISQNLFFKTLRKKDFKINGIRTSQNTIVHTGDIIEMYISDNLLGDNIYNFDGLYNNKIFEDDNILILNKPAKIEVLGENSLTSILNSHFDFIYPCHILGENSLTSILNSHFDFIYPCHRLDRNTQGLILFAKNKCALDILFNAFKQK